MVKAAGNVLKSLRDIPEEDIGVEEDVVEVHYAGLLAKLAVGCVDAVNLRLLVVDVFFFVAPGAICVRGWGHKVVFGLGYA